MEISVPRVRYVCKPDMVSSRYDTIQVINSNSSRCTLARRADPALLQSLRSSTSFTGAGKHTRGPSFLVLLELI